MDTNKSDTEQQSQNTLSSILITTLLYINY